MTRQDTKQKTKNYFSTNGLKYRHFSQKCNFISINRVQDCTFMNRYDSDTYDKY